MGNLLEGQLNAASDAKTKYEELTKVTDVIRNHLARKKAAGEASEANEESTGNTDEVELMMMEHLENV